MSTVFSEVKSIIVRTLMDFVELGSGAVNTPIMALNFSVTIYQMHTIVKPGDNTLDSICLSVSRHSHTLKFGAN